MDALCSFQDTNWRRLEIFASTNDCPHWRVQGACSPHEAAHVNFGRLESASVSLSTIMVAARCHPADR